MCDVPERQPFELLLRVADDLAEHPIDANEAAVECDQGHPDGRFVDREPEQLLGFAQSRGRCFGLLLGRLFTRQKPLAFAGVPSCIRDVARHGAHAENPCSARVADQEVLVRDRERLLGLPVAKVRLARPAPGLSH